MDGGQNSPGAGGACPVFCYGLDSYDKRFQPGHIRDSHSFNRGLFIACMADIFDGRTLGDKQNEREKMELYKRNCDWSYRDNIVLSGFILGKNDVPKRAFFFFFFGLEKSLNQPVRLIAGRTPCTDRILAGIR